VKRLLLPHAALALAITLASCGHKADDGHEHAGSGAEPPAAMGVTFNPKSGLLIPADTAKFIGLETVDVFERSVSVTREIPARVFRTAKINEPRALASAVLSAVDATFLQPGLTGTTATGALAAAVMRLERTQEPQNGWVEAILQVDDAVRSLPEGGFITLRFTEHSTNAVPAVPLAALLHTTTGDFVYTMNGEHFVRAAVKLGRMDGEFAEITEGIYAGDKVVVHPVMTLWMTELHNVNGGDACCIKQETKK
jgi:hypothetical protein